MPTGPEILFDYVLPSLIVGVGLALNRAWLTGLAVAIAWIVAACGIGGTPHWPPGSGDASYWLVWVSVPIAVLALLDALLKPPIWLRLPALLVLFGGCEALLLRPLAAHPPSLAGVWLIAIAAGAGLWWTSIEVCAQRFSGGFSGALVALQFAGAAAVLGISNDIKPSQECVALMGTALAAAMATGLWRRRLPLARGPALVWAVPLAGTFIVVHFYYYTEPPAAAVGLVLVSPILAFIADLPLLRRQGRRWQATIRLAAMLLAIGAAAGLSARQAAAANQPGQTGSQNADY